MTMNYQSALTAVLNLAQRYHYEKQHSHQVARLALMFFDQLKNNHNLDDYDRLLLEAGALLHDIGWYEGQKRHHKTAMSYILASDLPFERSDLIMLALIARYHRKSMPQENHDYYTDLNPNERRRLAFLAGMVRLADGLDRSHSNRIQTLSCKINDDSITVFCQSQLNPEEEFSTAENKSDLLSDAFNRTINFQAIPV